MYRTAADSDPVTVPTGMLDDVVTLTTHNVHAIVFLLSYTLSCASFMHGILRVRNNSKGRSPMIACPRRSEPRYRD